MKKHPFIIGVILGCVISFLFVTLTKQYYKRQIIEDAVINYGLPPMPEIEVTYAYHKKLFGADWYGFKARATESNAAEWRSQVDKLYAEGRLLDNVEVEWISSAGDSSDIEVKLSDMNK
ncbi:hypothetical protein NT6N_24820 [Oceaniferula spumae]|uniref:Uncharacterized protein n=1 Tax=Oceaniferula spumae TaxID=2979115 RepID=A0AAT9FMQ2_9BACT